MLEAIVLSLGIFFARLIDVSMGTTRQILIFRGQRRIAAPIAFFEIIIWAVALGRVITQLDQFYYLIAFALGFAAGNYLGSIIEEKLALGYMFAHVVTKKRPSDLAKKLRKLGFGVTEVHGKGLKGSEIILDTLFKRKDIRLLVGTIEKHDKDAFYSIMDVHQVHGGYIRHALKKK